jgi:8-oxo-dGTP pyrophosphatase MutT (NUDIX family)
MPAFQGANVEPAISSGRSKSEPLDGVAGRHNIPRNPNKRKAKPAVRLQYAALPYRFNEAGTLEILLVTTRQSKRWILPKGWPIKGLRPPRSAAREAFEEAGVTGKIGAKSVGSFTYDKMLDEQGIAVQCEIKVYPLLVKKRSAEWPEVGQRLSQWAELEKALSLIEESGIKAIVTAFAERGGSGRTCWAVEAQKAEGDVSRPPSTPPGEKQVDARAPSGTA